MCTLSVLSMLLRQLTVALPSRQPLSHSCRWLTQWLGNLRRETLPLRCPGSCLVRCIYPGIKYNTHTWIMLYSLQDISIKTNISKYVWIVVKLKKNNIGLKYLEKKLFSWSHNYLVMEMWHSEYVNQLYLGNHLLKQF